MKRDIVSGDSFVLRILKEVSKGTLTSLKQNFIKEAYEVAHKVFLVW